MLLFTASEVESATVSMGVNPAAAGLLGGMGGGIAQAYATMGASLVLFHSAPFLVGRVPRDVYRSPA